jgi:DNA-binding MarR family transcriptional regulator
MVNQMNGIADDDVLEAVHAVMHLFRSRQYGALHGGPRALSHLEGRVLGLVARQPGATQSDLVARSGRDKGQLARLLGGLKERGLIESRADEADRRSQRLWLSDAGRVIQQQLQRERRKLADAAVAGLSDAERRQLVALLARVRANLDPAA